MGGRNKKFKLAAFCYYFKEVCYEQGKYARGESFSRSSTRHFLHPVFPSWMFSKCQFIQYAHTFDITTEVLITSSTISHLSCNYNDTAYITAMHEGGELSRCIALRGYGKRGKSSTS